MKYTKIRGKNVERILQVVGEDGRRKEIAEGTEVLALGGAMVFTNFGMDDMDVAEVWYKFTNSDGTTSYGMVEKPTMDYHKDMFVAKADSVKRIEEKILRLAEAKKK
jgi:hypothetical protein